MGRRGRKKVPRRRDRTDTPHTPTGSADFEGCHHARYPSTIFRPVCIGLGPLNAQRPRHMVSNVGGHPVAALPNELIPLRQLLVL
eukprot:5626290-Pyramimonas_sp.AAC.1